MVSGSKYCGIYLESSWMTICSDFGRRLVCAKRNSHSSTYSGFKLKLTGFLFVSFAATGVVPLPTKGPIISSPS